MTGYGEAHCHEDGLTYSLELRSVNNRYFKPVIKLPESLQHLESEVEKWLRARISRGSVTCAVRIRSTGRQAAYDINVEAAQWYLDQLHQIKPLSQDASVDMTALLMLPGVCLPKETSEEDKDHQGEIIRRLTDEAVGHLMEMRRIEGQALRDDLLANCQYIRERLDTIRQRSPIVVNEYHERLTKRVDQLTAKAQITLAEADLAREVALYADRCDISEELIRLASHLDQFAQLCAADQQNGRKLDFLAQELLREANTVASKANDAEICQRVVDVKSAIDRIKEQVQNVE